VGTTTIIYSAFVSPVTKRKRALTWD